MLSKKVSVYNNFVLVCVTHIFLFCPLMGKMIWCCRIMNVNQRTVVGVYKPVAFILLCCFERMHSKGRDRDKRRVFLPDLKTDGQWVVMVESILRLKMIIVTKWMMIKNFHDFMNINISDSFLNDCCYYHYLELKNNYWFVCNYPRVHKSLNIRIYLFFANHIILQGSVHVQLLS